MACSVDTGVGATAAGPPWNIRPLIAPPAWPVNINRRQSARQAASLRVSQERVAGQAPQEGPSPPAFLPNNLMTARAIPWRYQNCKRECPPGPDRFRALHTWQFGFFQDTEVGHL